MHAARRPLSPRAHALAAALLTHLALSGLAGCGGASIFAGDAGAPDAGAGGHDAGEQDAGSQPDAGSGEDGGLDGGACRIACGADSDCLPPYLICAALCCAPSCLRDGCAAGESCEVGSGHCVPASSADAGAPLDGGALPDAGAADGGSLHDGGSGSDGGAGHDGGSGPDGGAGHDAGPPDAGSDAGPPPADGGQTVVPVSGGLNNPNGCGACEPCSVDSDCAAAGTLGVLLGAACVDGFCAGGCLGAGSALGDFFCQQGGGDLSCVGEGSGTGTLQSGYCVPSSGTCAEDDGGPTTCHPAGYSTSCTPAPLPGPAFGAEAQLGTSPAGLATGAIASARLASGSTLHALQVFPADGGPSFLEVELEGSAPTSFAESRAGHAIAQSDPSLAAAGSLAALAFGQLDSSAGADGGATSVQTLQLSTSSGAGWSAPAEVAGPDRGDGTDSVALPQLAAGAGGLLALGYRTVDASGASSVYVRTSSDSGASWSARVRVGAASSSSTSIALAWDPAPQSPQPLFGAWMGSLSTAAGTTDALVIARSINLGAGWSAPVAISSSADDNFGSVPSLAVDPGHRAYVVYPDAASGSSWNVQLSLVDGSGSPALLGTQVLNDDAAGCAQHLQPRIALDAATGALLVAFADDRAGGEGNVWVTRSTDRGATWSANARASSSSFRYDWLPASPISLGTLGAWASGGAYGVAWSDPRGGQNRAYAVHAAR